MESKNTNQPGAKKQPSGKKKMFDINMIKSYMQDKENSSEVNAMEQLAIQDKKKDKNSIQAPVTDEERKLVFDKLKGKFDEAEIKVLQDVEVKAASIFYTKHPNVQMVHRIPDTSYSFFKLNQQKLKDVIDFIEKNKGPGPGMPQIGQKEIADFRFGAIRNSKIPYLRYDWEKHNTEYNNLATFIMDYCQEEMRSVYNLKEVFVPENDVLDQIEKDLGEQMGGTIPQDKRADRESKSNIFMSSEFYRPTKEQKVLNSKKTALVLIQGTGAVRAGIWARSASNNDGFEIGSALPQVEWALMNEYAVLVMNPNENENKDGKPVPLNGTMDQHAYHVWDTYVEPSGFQQILVIAHSAGGGCLTTIQTEFANTFYQKVKQIAYTDSWTIVVNDLNEEQAAFMSKNAVHYQASDLPLGRPLEDQLGPTCPNVSAGHKQHEYTTGCAWPMIMQQFDRIKELDINAAFESANAAKRAKAAKK